MNPLDFTPAAAGSHGNGTRSSKRHPCPICGRTKDGDCEIRHDGLVFCHRGTSSHPPEWARKPGDYGQCHDGQTWAFLGDSDLGRAQFRLHQPLAGNGNGNGHQQINNVVPLRPQAAPTPITGPVQLARLDPERAAYAEQYTSTSLRRWLEPDAWADRVQAYGYQPFRYAYGEDLWVDRIEPPGGKKTFRPFHCVDGVPTPGAGPEPWPLYNHGLAASCSGHWVLETEGEKAADWAMRGGLVAISQPGHAHKPEQTEARYRALQAAGIAGVVYLADHDAEGRRRADQARQAASDAGLPLIVLPAVEVWPDLPAGGSIDDAPGTAAERAEQLVAAVTAAPPEPAEQQQDQPQRQPKRRTMAPDEVMQLLPERIGTPRVNLRTNDFHCGEQVLTADDVGRLYTRLSNPTERWTKDCTADCLVGLAKEHQFDPVAEELTTISRTVEPLPLEQWQQLDRHLLGIDDPIAAAFLPQFLISAVARVFRPGCSVRRTPVLIGPQWRGKTRMGRILFGKDHWVENVADLGKDDLLRLQAGWGVELSELNGITRRKDQEALKAFLTATEDVFRQPYGKGVGKYPRRCVFWGTSNGPPLRDLSGSTRFVCIPLPDRLLPLEWAAEHRGALWSRALELFRQIPDGEEPWDRATEEERAAIAERNSNHQEIDPWSHDVERMLAEALTQGRVPVSVPEILDRLQIPKGQQTNAAAARVRQLAERSGWEWARRRPGGGGNQRKGLWPPETTEPPLRPPGGSQANASAGGWVLPAVPPETTETTRVEEKEEWSREQQQQGARTEGFDSIGGLGGHSSPDASDASGSGCAPRWSQGGSQGGSQPPPRWFGQLVELRRAHPDALAAVLVNLLDPQEAWRINGREVAEWLPLADEQISQERQP